jgi:hypothetical protein
MAMQPNPTMLPALLEERGVVEHRSLFCDHYDPCLDEALRQRWRSWSCSCCQLFAPLRAHGRVPGRLLVLAENGTPLELALADECLELARADEDLEAADEDAEATAA